MRKERVDNMNDPQIIITGLPSEHYKLGSSNKEVCFSNFATYSHIESLFDLSVKVPAGTPPSGFTQ